MLHLISIFLWPTDVSSSRVSCFAIFYGLSTFQPLFFLASVGNWVSFLVFGKDVKTLSNMFFYYRKQSKPFKVTKFNAPCLLFLYCFRNKAVEKYHMQRRPSISTWQAILCCYGNQDYLLWRIWSTGEFGDRKIWAGRSRVWLVQWSLQFWYR